MLAMIGKLIMIFAGSFLLVVAIVQWQTGEFGVNGASVLGLALFGLGAVVYLHDHDTHEAGKR